MYRHVDNTYTPSDEALCASPDRPRVAFSPISRLYGDVLLTLLVDRFAAIDFTATALICALSNFQFPSR